MAGPPGQGEEAAADGRRALILLADDNADMRQYVSKLLQARYDVVAVERVGLSVADQGVGIPGEAQAQIFERFYRAGNTNPFQISGIGIGLYLVRDIVQAHGGAVEVDSAEGRGSVFTVWLPLAPAGEAGTGSGLSQSRSRIRPPHTAGAMVANLARLLQRCPDR
ncbi:MAG TPA: ATP-binding protein [Herpetosiphonaceae bacterium]|nr:ATP-binding protein [Herpetosiphonaceae bacterium]